MPSDASPPSLEQISQSVTQELQATDLGNIENASKKADRSKLLLLAIPVIIVAVAVKAFLPARQASGRPDRQAAGLTSQDIASKGFDKASNRDPFSDPARRDSSRRGVQDVMPFDPSSGTAAGGGDMEQMDAMRRQIEARRQAEGGEAPQGPRGSSQGGGPGQRGNPRAGGASEPPPPEYTPPAFAKIPYELAIRTAQNYQQWISANSGSQVAYEAEESAMRAAAAAQPPAASYAGVDASNQHLFLGAQDIAATRELYLPAGSFLTAVTNQAIDTDYPSTVTATVTAPEELRGGTLLVSYSGVTIERATATANRLVMQRDGVWKEFDIEGVVRTDLPQLNGEVDHHYARKLVPTVVNAGLAGGAIAMAANDDQDKINTRDQIYNNMIQSGISGIQQQVAEVNQGKPDLTVVVRAGQEFQVLLTKGITIR